MGKNTTITFISSYHKVAQTPRGLGNGPLNRRGWLDTGVITEGKHLLNPILSDVDR